MHAHAHACACARARTHVHTHVHAHVHIPLCRPCYSQSYTTVVWAVNYYWKTPSPWSALSSKTQWGRGLPLPPEGHLLSCPARWVKLDGKAILLFNSSMLAQKVDHFLCYLWQFVRPVRYCISVWTHLQSSWGNITCTCLDLQPCFCWMPSLKCTCGWAGGLSRSASTSENTTSRQAVHTRAGWQTRSWRCWLHRTIR